MPIYEYKCRECSQVSEIFQRSNTDENVKCSYCGSEDLEKCFSASYMIKTGSNMSGATCCGRPERCDVPPCSAGEGCRKV